MTARAADERVEASGRNRDGQGADGAALAELLGAIRACRLCRDGPRHGDRLPHEPRPVVQISREAPILIAGQAPGTRVHETGIPFNDRSGDRLRDWLGVDRDTFYDPRRFAIAPMGFCFPGQDARGGDLPPRRECAPVWRARLLAELPDLGLILVIGQYAIAYHLPDRTTRGLTETVRAHGHGRRDADGRLVMVLPHPSWRNTAWLKRNPWFEADVLPVLRREVRGRLGG